MAKRIAVLLAMLVVATILSAGTASAGQYRGWERTVYVQTQCYENVFVFWRIKNGVGCLNWGTVKIRPTW